MSITTLPVVLSLCTRALSCSLLMKLPAPFAVALQTAFNRYVELDPDSTDRIATLRGKVVCVNIEPPGIGIWYIFGDNRVEVVEDFGADADVVISGGPFSFLSMALGRSTIFDGDIKITGDTTTAQKFSRCLNEIDIDWEEHLSRLTGDAVAHQLGRFSRGFRQWLTERGDSLQENTADYLRDETGNVPHSWELDEFVEQVDDLRDRTDLLEARITAANTAAQK